MPPPTAAFTPSLSPEYQALVVADIARHLNASEPLRIVGGAATAITVALVFRDTAHPSGLGVWLAAMLAHSAYNAWVAWRRKRPPQSVPMAAAQATQNAAPNPGRRLRAVTRTEAINGGLWMAAELLLLPGSDYAHRGLLMVLLSGLGAGVMQSLSAHLPALMAFFVPAVLGFFVAGMFGHGDYFGVALVLLLMWVAVNLNYARLMHRTLIESLRNRHAAAALAADLQVQKDRAVELSQSRSRFLAAASHDLRQPVHALSLFVAALSQQPPAAEAQRLLGHMRATVDAMSGLFNALLDLSKLDAALVQPAWARLPLQPLLARVAAEHSTVAAALGLGFGFEMQGPVDLAVHTDPVLLERILRNLLSNALRYTPQGQVRLQARLRGGAVLLRVADTGIGIPAARQGEVFHEFVQLRQARSVPGHPASPADQETYNPPQESDQGLGLGLAFVRRLSELLGLRLSLRSRPGRGSVFSVRLPLAGRQMPDAALTGNATRLPGEAMPSLRVPTLPTTLPTTTLPTPAPANAAPATVSLQPGDLVLLIDDALRVRQAMTALLTGWGCQVLSAGSLAELTPQLRTLTRLPRLIVCDARLRSGASGLATVAQLRVDFNEAVPAILITGDTAPERLREALASGLVLLHKPVVNPQALQDAIAMALSASESEADGAQAEGEGAQ